MSDSTSRALITLAAIALLFWAVWLVREVLPPFLVATALAFVLDPLLDRMQARGIPRGVAVAITFAAFLAVFLATMAFLIPVAANQIADLLGNLNLYGGRVQASVNAWAHSNAELLRRFNIPEDPAALWARYQGSVAGYLQWALQRTVGALQASAGALAWLLVVPIVTLYLMMDLDRLKARVYFLIAAPHRETVVELANQVGRVFAAYLRGLLMVCALYGLLVYLVLGLGFQLSYAVIVGLVAAVLYAVPYLGQMGLIAGCCILAWATVQRLDYVIGVAISLALIGQLFDQLITPRVIGRQVGLHPVLGLFALMVGGHLFGLAGMVIAVPVAASLRVVLIHLFPALAAPLPEPEPAASVPLVAADPAVPEG